MAYIHHCLACIQMIAIIVSLTFFILGNNVSYKTNLSAKYSFEEYNNRVIVL
jgi:hypothetical protein